MREQMADRVFTTLSYVSVGFLCFLVGAWVILAERFPYDGLRNAWQAADALYWRVKASDDTVNNDLWKPSRYPQSGVTVSVPAKMAPGYTLYTSGDSDSAYLIDADGHVRHRWSLPYSQYWEPGASVKHPVADHDTYFRKAVMYPDGGLLAIYDGLGDTPYGYGMVRLDKDSHVLWKFMQHAHHDFDVMPDGHILALTQEIVDQPFAPRPELKTPRIDDFIVELDSNGHVIDKTPVLQALDGTAWLRYLDGLPAYLEGTGDYVHTNDVDYVPPAIASKLGLHGNRLVLVSMRESNALGIIDLDREHFVWGMRGSWVGQHDPDLLDNGHILLFDNNGNMGSGGRSRVLEVDPTTEAIVWRYGGSEQQPLESIIRSAQEREPNGNTLITESDGGRILEVTPDGETVWQYVNPARNALAPERTAIVSGATRIAPDHIDPEFLKTLQTQPQ